MLVDVKKLIGVEDDRIEIIYDSVRKRLLTMLNHKLDLKKVPDELEYIVDEVTIVRFNRLGSEGLATESMDGHSATYITNDFAPYQTDIDAYIKKHANTGGVPRRSGAFFV